MNRLVRTVSGHPGERGRELGAARAGQVAACFDAYQRHFEAGGAGLEEVSAWGEEALTAVAAWAPSLAEEIEGVAAGASLTPARVAALNARTEILAKVARRQRGECSVIVALDPAGADPVAAQTWDWHEEMASAWLVWEFYDEASGLGVQTLTEAGILGKVGVNSAGVAVLLNILHHDADGEGPVAVPVHLLLRRILTEAATVFDAVKLISSAPLSASSAVTVIAAEECENTALTAELRPGERPDYLLPDDTGVLLHTNHFLAERGRAGDREPLVGPDSMFRFDLLRRRAARLRKRTPAALVAALGSHLGAGGALCCHPEPGAAVGERYATLATVTVEPRARRLCVSPGGPCEAGEGTWTELLPPTNPATAKETDVRPN